jgi:hypothetical protein
MKLRFAALLLLPILEAPAENVVLQGEQSSEVRFEMVQEIVPNSGVLRLGLGYVIPGSFNSPCFSQDIRDFHVDFSIPPAESRKSVDSRGNEVLQVEWLNPGDPIKAVIRYVAVLRTSLRKIRTFAMFPLKGVPDEAGVYLRPTRLVPSDLPEIIAKARSLTASAQTEFDAVQQILTWMVDRVKYVQHPEKYDALFSIRTGKGNCQNYSHLAATLMRAAGIPVRIVNGFTLRQPFEMKVTEGSLTMRMAQGRHSWIEVYFTDLGWVPFDPQNMELFTSNRFIRVEVGLDNEETVKDGSIRWKRAPGSLQMPLFQEVINGSFTSDVVNVAAERQTYGPRKMLFSPPVEAAFTRFAFRYEQEAAPSVSGPASAGMTYDIPDTLGNLEFPENEDFLGVRELKPTDEADEFTLRKNFLVETAEYVTEQGQKYAQTFRVDRPIRVDKIGLALHKFGGAGNLWLELSGDDGTGKPGALIETSDILPLETLPAKAGYSWCDFSFGGSRPALAPGRYWIVFAYTGSPVVNWFFSYGKSVGPNDGTRFNTMFDDTWSRSLSYEFNYRVIGLSAR